MLQFTAGSDGSRPGDRARRAGYSSDGVAENIHQGQRDARSAFNGWMKSPPHRKNLLNPTYRHFGAGTAGGYWTQVKARPCALPVTVHAAANLQG